VNFPKSPFQGTICTKVPSASQNRARNKKYFEKTQYFTALFCLQWHLIFLPILPYHDRQTDRQTDNFI